MKSAEKPSITKQLYWGVGLIIFLFLVVGAISLDQINSLGSLPVRIFNHPFAVTNAALFANSSVAKIHRDMKDVVLANDTISLEKAIARVDAEESETLGRLDVVKKLILGSEGQALERETREMFLAWRSIRAEVIQLVKKGETREAIAITQGKGADHEFQLERQMLKLTTYAHDKAVGFIGQAEIAKKRSYFLTGITVGMGMLLAIIIAYITSRQILTAMRLQRQAEEKLDNFIDRAPLGMAIATKQGEFIRVNRAFCEMLGYSENELLTKTNREITHPDDVNLTNNYMARIENGEIDVFETEKRYIRKSGDTVWAMLSFAYQRQENDQESYYIAQIQDITEKRRKDEEQRLQSQIVKFMAEGVYLIRADGSIVYTNPKFEEMFGYDPGEMIGQHASIVNYPTERDPEETAREIMGIIARDGFWEGEIQNIRKDGTPFWCQANVIAFDHSSYGRVMVAVHTDITERKQMEAEKALLGEQLRQAQKLEAVGTLAGGIAHDFNNILAAIIGYAEMAGEEVSDSSPAKRDIQEVVKAGIRAKELVKHILAFSRKAQHELVPVRMHLIVEEGLSLLRATVPTTIKIIQDVDPQSGTVMADPSQIHQVIMNLCTNAAQAMDENGGILEVSLGNEELSADDLAEDQILKPGPYVKLTVSDNGPGIGEDLFPLIFDPYFTTKEVGKGSGLGLSVVHGIVKSHGGMITVASSPGGGATFKVFLPKTREVPVPEGRENNVLPTGNERILVVDDEINLVEIIKRRLEHLGYKVTVATDSLAALKLFRSQPDSFDLVISDQTMPGFTGDQLAREIMRIRPACPVIICSGYSSKIDADRVDFPGVRAFIMKPVDNLELAETVRNVLDA